MKTEEKRETISEKIDKKEKDLSKMKHCNICDCPRYVSFQEKDEETGKVISRTHLVECNGHLVPGYLWNLSKDYDDYQKFIVRYRERTNRPRHESKPSHL